VKKSKNISTDISKDITRGDTTESEDGDTIRKTPTETSISNKKKQGIPVQKKKRSRNKITNHIELYDDKCPSDGEGHDIVRRSDNWSFHKKSAENGFVLHMTLDDIKSMINDGKNTQEIKNRTENLHSIASDTDTMPNSSDNSNTYLLPSSRRKHQYFNMSKRFLPRSSCDHSPMDMIDTCLSNHRH